MFQIIRLTFAALALAAATITHAADAGFDQPFALQAGANFTVQSPGVTVTLRSLAADAGCASADDCSAMLFRGSLVLRRGSRMELHALDAVVAPDAPARIAFAGYELRIQAVRSDAQGKLAATFTLTEPPAGKPAANDTAAHDARIAKGSTAERVTARKSAGATPSIWIEPKRSMLSNAGWTLSFRTSEPLRELDLIMPGGESEQWEPAQGEGREFYAGAGFLDATADVRVRGIAADGRTLGPYTLAFDALGALREQDLQSLRSLPATWVQYKGIYVYFGTLFGTNCGIREVRYSIDSKALDQRMPLPPCSLRRHGIMPSAHDGIHDDILKLERTPEFVAVQVVYYDGTESPMRVVQEGLH
jgi:hypothetical protein